MYAWNINKSVMTSSFSELNTAVCIRWQLASAEGCWRDDLRLLVIVVIGNESGAGRKLSVIYLLQTYTFSL